MLAQRPPFVLKAQDKQLPPQLPRSHGLQLKLSRSLSRSLSRCSPATRASGGEEEEEVPVYRLREFCKENWSLQAPRWREEVPIPGLSDGSGGSYRLLQAPWWREEVPIPGLWD